MMTGMSNRNVYSYYQNLLVWHPQQEVRNAIRDIAYKRPEDASDSITFLQRDLKLIAQVTLPDSFIGDPLGIAYSICNEPNRWWEKPNVLWFGTNQQEDTLQMSMGDIIGAPDGSYHLVLRIGFKKVRILERE